MHCIVQLYNHRLLCFAPLVLKLEATYYLFSADWDQTVSRRSEPSSRTILTVEQTDPWKMIHNQDMMSRHRGAEQFCR